MTIQLPIVDFSREQHELWKRVVYLWELSKGRDENQIRATLHPEYVGWDISTALPHDRNAAVLSVSGDSPELREYELHPQSVQVYGGRVGVVHYAYSAVVVPKGDLPVNVTGKWCEVYLKEKAEWLLISVSGRPDVARDEERS
jgi:hypothetical protein